MQTIGSVLNNVDHEIHVGWEHVRSWAKSVFTRERTTEIILLSLTLALCAFVLFFFQKGLQHFTITQL
jgi:hypothetical protein